MHLPKILLIDDNQENIVFLKTLFTKWSLELNVAHDPGNALIRMNIYKPDIVILSTQLKLQYEDTISLILSRNCKIILLGIDTKNTFSKWKNSPAIKGPLAMPLEIMKFKNILFPFFKKGYVPENPQSHIEVVINDKIAVIEVAGEILWEQTHEMKTRMGHTIRNGEVMGVVFIFHRMENDPEDLEENLLHLLSFIHDEHFNHEYIKFLTVEDEVAGVLQASKAFRKIERVASYAEAYMKIENILANKSNLGLDLDFVRENMLLVEDVYDELGNLIKKAGESFNYQELEKLKSQGVFKIYYARELSKLGMNIENLDTLKTNIEDIIMHQVEASANDSLEENLQDNEKKMVVVIDDDKSSQQLLGKVLERMGLEYKIAQDGTDGLKQCITYNPNLILLDLMMPKVNGVEFMKKYKEIRQKLAAPVVVISGVSRSDVVQTILKLGAKDYILKPLDLKTVMEKITRNIS